MTGNPPLHFDSEGLIPVVTTDAASGDVLMVAFMNAEALSRTRETGYVHYWSRSRHSLWFKGKTSGHVQKVENIFVNCDRNSLRIDVQQTGAVCHDGYPTCFYRWLGPDDSLSIVRDRWFDPADVYGRHGGIAKLTQLWWDAYRELAATDHTGHSRTSRLLHAKDDRLTPRLREELHELAGALDRTHRHHGLTSDVVLEGGQVCYWTILRCVRDGVPWDEVRPDRALIPIAAEDIAPITTTTALIRELAGRWDTEDGDDVAGRAHETLTAVARACALADVEPIDLIRVDLDELRTRSYLADFFHGRESSVTD